MRRPTFWTLILFPLISYAQQPAIQVKDINDDGSSFPDDLIEFNGKLYFRAINEFNGSELWTSDGTSEGTFMVKDIVPGSGNGSPGDFIIFRDSLFFGADNAMWVSDGTDEGTRFFKDIEKDDRGFVFEGFLYFSGNDFEQQLWFSDGTAVNTYPIQDPVGNIIEGAVQNYTAFDGHVFVSIGNDTWALKEDTAQQVGPANFASDITLVFEDRLYVFGFKEGPYYLEKGSLQPTLLTELNNGISVAMFHAATNGKFMIFTASNVDFGSEPWISDGTEQGTFLLKDLDNLANSGSSPADFVFLNDLVYFSATDPDKGTELYVSDGTETGTDLIDLNPGSASSNPRFLTKQGNYIFFTANTADKGGEAWYIDGATGVVQLLSDVAQGTSSSNPNGYVLLGNEVFFSAQVNNDRELYKVIMPTDPCANIICPEGQECIDGACFNICYDLNLGNDTLLNAGDSLVLDAGVDGVSYLWSTGDTSRTITVYASNDYWLSLGDICNSTDTINVLVTCDNGICPEGMQCIDGYCYDDPCALVNCPDDHACFEGACFPVCIAADLGADTLLNAGDSLVLDAGKLEGPYLWSTGDTSYNITVTTSGEYWLISGDCFYPSGFISVSFACDNGTCPEGQECLDGICVPQDPCEGVNCPEGNECYQGACYPSCIGIDLGPDLTLPAGTAIELDAGIGGYYTSWSTGQNSRKILVNSTGRYIVEVYGAGGCYAEGLQSDTINVKFLAYQDGTCPPGQFNLNGLCYTSNQSEECGDGYYLYNGECYPLEECSILSCPPGDTCYNGYCLPSFNPACDECGPDEVCYFGTCYPDCIDLPEITYSDLVSGALVQHFNGTPGDTVVVELGPDFSKVQWSNGDTGILSVTSSGEFIYLAEYDPDNCVKIGFVSVNFYCDAFAADPDCPDGQICQGGLCVAFDPCEGIDCPPGQACYNGFCMDITIQDCFSHPCPPGEECIQGICVTDTECSNVNCGPGETCYNGNCVATGSTDRCEIVDCGGVYSCMYGTCMETQLESYIGSATISGTVAISAGVLKSGLYDQSKKSGSGVEEARVYLLNESLDTVYRIDTTDASGNFVLENIAPGNYRIIVESGLYKMDENNSLVIESGTGTIELLALIGEEFITLGDVTAVPQMDDASAFRLYPNPSTGEVYLSLNQKLNEVAIEISDLSGRRVLERSFRNPGPEVRIVEHNDNLASGYYLVRVRVERNQAVTMKILVAD